MSRGQAKVKLITFCKIIIKTGDLLEAGRSVGYGRRLGTFSEVRCRRAAGRLLKRLATQRVLDQLRHPNRPRPSGHTGPTHGRWTPGDIAEVRRLRLSGLSVRAISEMYATGMWTIYRLIDPQRWPQR